MTVWYIRIASWVPKATNTNSEYVIIIAVPLQRSLHERASMLRYTHISCLVAISFFIYYLLENLSVDYVYPWTLTALLSNLQRKLTTVWSTSTYQMISNLSDIKNADFNSEISVSASTHTFTHMCVCVCIYIYIHTYIRTYIHTYSYVHTYIHTYVHTYVHTHIHTYM